jgi:hypothetical protein
VPFKTSSVEQAAQQASADAADDGAALAINSISTGSAGTCSDYLTGRARSKQKQSKNRDDRESGSHELVSFTPVNGWEGCLFHSLDYFMFCLENVNSKFLIL